MSAPSSAATEVTPQMLVFLHYYEMSEELDEEMQKLLKSFTFEQRSELNRILHQQSREAIAARLAQGKPELQIE